MTRPVPAPAIEQSVKTCLVSGAAGVVGAALGQWLLARDWYVTALDPRPPVRLMQSAAASGCSHRLRWVHGRAADSEALQAALAGQHCVAHLERFTDSQESLAWPDAMPIHARGCEALLGACAAAQLPVLLGSSAAVYGAAVCDLTEATAAVFSDVSHPRWRVGLADAYAEQSAGSLASSAGLRYCTARLIDVYGTPLQAGDDADPSEIAEFLAHLMRNEALPLGLAGDVLRSPCHADDAAEALGLLLESLSGLGPAEPAAILGQAFNIGRREPATLAHLADLLEHLSGRRVGRNAAQGLGSAAAVQRRVPIVDKLHEVLGWRARVSLRDGLARVLADLGLRTSDACAADPVIQVPFIQADLHLDNSLLQTLGLALASGQVTNHGPQAVALEAELGEWFGQPVALSGSGTGGLTAALLALGRRGVAILPSFTYLATLNAVRAAGMTPLFCDIDPGTWTMSAVHLRQLVERNRGVAAVVPVTVFGVVPDLAALAALTRPRGIALVLDDAHGWGSQSDAYRFADLRVLSMHATKNLAAVEGGVVLANDSRLLQAARLRIHHGLDAQQPLFSVHGGNFKISELHAAVGRQGLRHLAEDLQARRGHAERLAELIDRCPGLTRQQQNPQAISGWQNLGVRLELPAGACMDTAVADLRLRGVQARRYFWPPLHHLPGLPKQSLSNTEDLARRQLCLPLAHRMDPAQLMAMESILPSWAGRWSAPSAENRWTQEAA